ncbi:hypothetical protein NPS49_09625 [Pseudomonas putida]|uniref:hypothetical protein n=1 Tax=Pseudomonas putida TaxID=303 RepID=UPI002363B03C|nr:hypothetical protein [Pseudomonas putida]MDD2068576.1 hypothetical protein [Pseudomonas putida]HDS1738512.1 hypothetical protein [Pseudomonas putida]
MPNKKECKSQKLANMKAWVVSLVPLKIIHKVQPRSFVPFQLLQVTRPRWFTDEHETIKSAFEIYINGTTSHIFSLPHHFHNKLKFLG